MKDDYAQSAIPESSLSMLIAAARRHVKHAVGAIVEPFGLNAYQCWMLILLRDRGPMSLSELAGRMWMDHPTTSRLVHAMEESGLLMVQPDPNHGRKVLIGLNPDQVNVTEEIHSQVIVYRNRMEKGLSAEEKSALHSGLAKVILNLSEILDKDEREGTERKGGGRVLVG